MAEHDSHPSFIKTPQQLVVVVLFAFVVPIIGIVMLVQLVVGGKTADAAALAPEAVAKRIQPVGTVEFGAAGAAAGPRAGEEIFKTACFACHQTGAAGAPKIGDRAGWAKLVGQPLERLVQSAIKGKGAMPPRGGLPDLTDLELARSIVFMANQSGGRYKEPAEPKPAAAPAKPAAKGK